MPEEQELVRRARSERRKRRETQDSPPPEVGEIALNRRELRRGVLLSEILRPPRALRPFRPQAGSRRDR